MEMGIEHADSHTMSAIGQAIENAHNQHSSSDRAWALRRGIDLLYASLDQMDQPMESEIANQ